MRLLWAQSYMTFVQVHLHAAYKINIYCLFVWDVYHPDTHTTEHILNG